MCLLYYVPTHENEIQLNFDRWTQISIYNMQL